MNGTTPAFRAFDALRTALYVTAFVGFLAWAALQFRDLTLPFDLPLPPWVRPLGLVLMLGGGALALSCIAVFVLHGRGTPAPFDPPRAFVVRGLYRYVRNPMYLGGFVLLLGFGLWHRSPGMIAFAFGVPLLLHFFVVLIEEPGLERRFGENYRRYKTRVHRWLPRLRRPPDVNRASRAASSWSASGVAGRWATSLTKRPALRLLSTIGWVVLWVIWPQVTLALTLLVVGAGFLAFNGLIFWLTVVRKEHASSVAPMVGGVLAAAGIALLPVTGSWRWAWVPLVVDWGGLPKFLAAWYERRAHRRALDR